MKIGIIVFVGLIVLNMITYKSCTSYKDKYDKSKLEQDLLVTKFDSVLNMPTDTIVGPTKIIKKDSIITVTRWFEKPNKPDIESNTYIDSIINDSIDLRVKIEAKELYSVCYDYKPIYKYQERIINKNIPYPVEVIKEIKVPQSGLFFNVGLGYSDRFSAKVGLMYLSKRENTYNYDLIRYDDVNIHMLSYGIKF